MKTGGRIAAAIEVLQEIEGRYRPVSDALKDWGKSHRFAGSGDRNYIGNLVHDALRWKASSSWVMQSDKPRATVLATLAHHWDVSADALNAAFKDDKHAPSELTKDELSALTNPNSLKKAPLHVQANCQEWVAPLLEANFADEWVEEAAALAARAPIDLRVNTLKADREAVLKRLADFTPQTSVLSPTGIRLANGERDEKSPNIKAEPVYLDGQVEIQDEASQIAALMVFARPGETILDYCAGGGGKSLAMAATMENQGRIIAYDSDKRRLAPLYERGRRAAAEIIEIEPDLDALEPLENSVDRVLVDAPCSGSGTWRRRPDAKWRLKERTLADRITDQEEVLAGASRFVRPEGYLIYATCSVFADENEGQIAGFLDDRPDFELLSVGEVWQDLIGYDKPQPWSSDMNTVTLTPASTGTDGFFLAVLQKKR